MRRNWPSAAVLAVSVAVTSVFIIDFCNWIYECGCRSLWAGGSAHCNIHMAGTKHCPWCAIGTGGFATIFAAIAAVQGVVSFVPSRWPWPARLVAALAAFPAAGLVLALGVGWWKGYWD